jgi:hypothetical protein
LLLSYFFFFFSLPTVRFTAVPGATVVPAAGSWLRTLPFFFLFFFYFLSFFVVTFEEQPAALSAD